MKGRWRERCLNSRLPRLQLLKTNACSELARSRVYQSITLLLGSNGRAAETHAHKSYTGSYCFSIMLCSSAWGYAVTLILGDGNGKETYRRIIRDIRICIHTNPIRFYSISSISVNTSGCSMQTSSTRKHTTPNQCTTLYLSKVGVRWYTTITHYLVFFSWNLIHR